VTLRRLASIVALGLALAALITATAPAFAQPAATVPGAGSGSGTGTTEIEVPVIMLDTTDATIPGADEALDLANIVQSAAKGVTTVQEAPAIVTVITADEIKDRQFQDLGELVDSVPGWQRASIYDHAHLVARYAQFADHPDPQLRRARAVLGEELAAASAAAAVRAAASHGIIHGDLFRDNVLWDAGHIVAILDFEQASGGSFVYDLAVCINDWCWAGAPRLDVAGAMLAAYQQVRPLTAVDREAFVIEVRAAAARFTITRITDVYLAKVYNPEKDFRDFLARCDAWRGPALGQLSALL